MSSRRLRRSLARLATVAVALGSAGAAAADRCEGTLCDLYYGGAPASDAVRAEPAKPATINPNDTLLGRFFSGGTTQQQTAPPQPAQQQPPSAATPPRKPFVAVQGGGLLGMMNSAPQQRCTGTLCDLYYGGPPPEAPVTEPLPERAATGADAPQTEEPSRVIEQPVERHCADTRDPWACYRR